MTIKFLSNFGKIHAPPGRILDIHTLTFSISLQFEIRGFWTARSGGFGFHGMIDGRISVWHSMCGVGQWSRSHQLAILMQGRIAGREGWDRKTQSDELEHLHQIKKNNILFF